MAMGDSEADIVLDAVIHSFTCHSLFSFH